MRQGLVGIALLLLITAAAQAQQAGPTIDPETPTLTITARTVVIDAVVTDRSGRLVPNLTRDDFQVFENGVPQKTNFICLAWISHHSQTVHQQRWRHADAEFARRKHPCIFLFPEVCPDRGKGEARRLRLVHQL